ncbi:uncharacterized protein LOC133843638 isoform X1 [Drosophila sulfurigaster albostrigata]|uniref:uncharacterized protein LOC133843638 isoform X1 n=2 Tax=Drosophila sulfurigaster albostrigata TaxID=89887 RepID=UPI002D21C942|nr:uncharacterized protein LOC133843638 isoform X1 [Drosophila sulfurigaster albostrigata]
MRKLYCIPVCNWIGPLLLVATVLMLVNGEQQPEEHRIQRRFMWQQMDNSVMGGLMGRIFKGPTRAMKSMFGDLLPSTAGYAQNMMDFLPTETTRVKYIIRDPHTNKPMKIIKMRGSHKKLVKMLRPLPKPSVTEPSMLNYENRMRQLEKEQELIVEGKLPMTSDEALLDKYFKPQKSKPNSNEIVSGKIMEYQSWKPVYKSGEHPSSFVTMRPQPLTRLHTSIAASHENYGNHELLPKPEKLVSHRPHAEEHDEEEDDDFEQVEDENELPKHKGHQYEVTEHTGEASGELHALAPMESGFVPSHLYESPASNPSNPAPRPRSRYVHNPGSTSHTPTANTVITSTTTEAPNYPPGFLKKFREREQTKANNGKSRSKHQHQHLNHNHHQREQQIVYKESASDISPGYNVSFAMSSLRARLQEQQRQSKQEDQNAEMEAALVDAMNGDKWPTEVEASGSYLTSPIGPSAVAFEQPIRTPPRTEYKRQRKDVRQRGSIKFGDNPTHEDVM